MTIIQQLLADKPVVILDGAMGTELHRMGVDIGLPLWSARALLTAPHVVRNIHFWYLHAGADIITTNTFRTNIRTVRACGLASRWQELNLKAIQLAFEARERYRIIRPVAIAGSIAPVEDCYSPGIVPTDAALEDEHGAQADLLSGMGVDLLLAETINTVREAAIVARCCASTGKEFLMSIVCDAAGMLLSGESLQDAVSAILPFHPTAVLVNCVSAKHMHIPLQFLIDAVTIPVGCYANIGTPTTDGLRMHADVNAEEYASAAMTWRGLGARIIGGCCGTTPELLATMFKHLYPRHLVVECGIEDVRHYSYSSTALSP